jgi:hypothetical protein
MIADVIFGVAGIYKFTNFIISTLIIFFNKYFFFSTIMYYLFFGSYPYNPHKDLKS